MKEVLLIHPTEFFTGKSYMRNIIPLHLLLLGTPLKQENIHVRFFSLLEDGPGIPQDLKELALYYRKLIKCFQEYSSTQFIGISCYSSNFFIPSFVIGHAIREALPEATIMVGGYGVNTCVEDFIFEGAPFDYVFAGEADIELTQVVKKLINSSKDDRLPGKYGKPVLLQCPEIQDLDSLPLIDWSLLEGTELIKSPTIMVPYYASRGCPFKCKYCCDLSNLSGLGYFKRWRPRGVANIMKELHSMQKFFGSKQVSLFIHDPIFGLDKNWKMSMLDSFIKETKDWKNFTYWIEERVETLDEESVQFYSKSDMIISLGFESGSPRMLKLMNKTKKPDKYLEKMLENREILEKYKIYYSINVLFGFPGETNKELIESQDYISQLFRETKYGFLFALKYQFFPGSYVFQNAHTPEYKEMNVLFPDWYKRMGNTLILPGICSPSKELGNTELLKKVRDWIIPLYKKIAMALSPSPNGKISFRSLKNIFIERFMLEWKYRPEYAEMVLEALKTNEPELLPLGKEFQDFIKNAENKTNNHLEAMKNIVVKLRNLTAVGV
ncbi:MAG: B12-binding domain-containing radical SAM protein [Spirochaetales bacterium]|nr:B12-binding domain-containing radical SAM protein [Spirochaetales bacterium]